MGAVAPMVTDVSQNSNPHKSRPRSARPKHLLPLFAPAKQGFFRTLRTHACTRSRTLLTIGRYWLFKRRWSLFAATGGPLELLRNPSGRVMPAALLLPKSLYRRNTGAGHLRPTLGAAPPRAKPERGLLGCRGGAASTLKKTTTRGLFRSLRGNGWKPAPDVGGVGHSCDLPLGHSCDLPWLHIVQF